MYLLCKILRVLVLGVILIESSPTLQSQGGRGGVKLCHLSKIVGGSFQLVHNDFTLYYLVLKAKLS